MSRTIHPSELAQLLQNRFIAKSISVSILILALILMAGESRSSIPESRIWLFGSSIVCAFLSR
jgi:hypothetical protein